jgi:hypothetical protein
MSWAIAGRYVRAAATDPDAQAYLQAVETADGQALEFEVARAIDNFVLGCKADGIWSAIKASCILAGARTLNGALVPLVGTAPTNVGGLFVAGDYNRKTGLVGNGSTKYLDSNRNNNADPQDSKHVSVYASVPATSISAKFPCDIGAGRTTAGATTIGRRENNGTCYTRVNRSETGALPGGQSGFNGLSRSNGNDYSGRNQSTTVLINGVSQSPFNGNIFVFADNATPFLTDTMSNARLAFYSIGESLDLALLDARITTLIQAIDAAI